MHFLQQALPRTGSASQNKHFQNESVAKICTFFMCKCTQIVIQPQKNKEIVCVCVFFKHAHRFLLQILLPTSKTEVINSKRMYVIILELQDIHINNNISFRYKAGSYICALVKNMKEPNNPCSFLNVTLGRIITRKQQVDVT